MSRHQVVATYNFAGVTYYTLPQMKDEQKEFSILNGFTLKVTKKRGNLFECEQIPPQVKP